jgi:hypothetical protein
LDSIDYSSAGPLKAPYEIGIGSAYKMSISGPNVSFKNPHTDRQITEGRFDSLHRATEYVCGARPLAEVGTKIRIQTGLTDPKKNPLYANTE